MGNLSRLKSQLLTSGLSQKDSALFQVINSLIREIEKLDQLTNGSDGIGAAGSNTVINHFDKFTIPLPGMGKSNEFEDYADSPYPSLTVAGSTIINNNTSNIINQSLLTTGIESYSLENYADDPYPSIGMGGVVNNVINNNNIINNTLLNTGIEKYELENYSDDPYPALGTSQPLPIPTAGNPNITNDDTTNATMYPVWVTANSGSLPLKVSSSKLSWNPSLGALNVVGTLSLGTNPALTGILRLPNNQYLYGRNAANTDHYQITGIDTSNRVVIGGSGGGVLILEAVTVTGNVLITKADPRLILTASAATNAFIDIDGPSTYGAATRRYASSVLKWMEGIGIGATGNAYGWYNNTNAIVAMSLSEAGVLNVNGFGVHTFSAGAVGNNWLVLENTNSSTTSRAILNVKSGTADGYIQAVSQGYTTSNELVANSVVLLSGSAGGLSIASNNAAGMIRYYTGGGTERGRMHASGGFSWGDTTDPGATNFRVAGVTIFGNTARLMGYTLATLPSSPSVGDLAYITDSLFSPTYDGIVNGGGSYIAKVFFNGTTWRTA
jgi:hypothetical protein